MGLKEEEESRRFEFRNAAATGHGHQGAIASLVEIFSAKLGECHRAVLRTRRTLMTGITPEFNRAAAEYYAEKDRNMLVCFNMGSELEGYEQFWDLHVPLPYGKCTELYLLILHRARRAALQMVVGLRRECGFPRDVAVLIGKYVYRTREEDPEAWL